MDQLTMGIANTNMENLTVRQIYKIEVVKGLLGNPDYTNAEAHDFAKITCEIVDALIAEDVAYEKLCKATK